MIRNMIMLGMILLMLGCIGGAGQQPAAGGSGGQPASEQPPDEAAVGVDDAASETESGGLDTGPEESDAENGTSDAGASGTTRKNETGGSGDGILLLGRSVGYGWAQYMGLEYDDATGTYNGTYGGNSIRYREVSGPPDISDSAIGAMDEYPDKIVFFKLCFVDFSGETGEGLIENEGYVRKVYDEAVTKRGRVLIVGNALPQTSQETGAGLRYNHKKYNEWLENFTATHENVYIVDLYGLLADQSGDLRADYAVSYDDSHLNDLAYSKITPELMRAIGEARGAD